MPVPTDNNARKHFGPKRFAIPTHERGGISGPDEDIQDPTLART